MGSGKRTALAVPLAALSELEAKGLRYVLSRIKRPDHEGKANGGQAETSIQFLIILSTMVY